ncbi:hypothetical protein HYU92_01235 [Candidatus Curtissbacteria bacterium]|nr:hypothetical protein [Candidatus Curtissbacteria bacterium]
MKKGFAQFVPLVAIAFAILIGLSIISADKTTNNQDNILSSSDKDNGSSGSGSSGSGSSDSGSSGSSDSDSSDNPSTSTSSGPGSADTTRIESNTGDTRTRIETRPGETRIETRNEQGRFETRLKDDKEETKIRTGNLRIELKREGDKIVTTVKNENDEEVELEDEETDELLEDASAKLEVDGVKFATDSGRLDIIQNGRRVRINFPLSVNPTTGELFVTTPAGEKVVAILPDTAIQNMLSAGILTRVEPEPEPLPSPSPGATESATVVETGIELTQLNNQPVYIISGIKNKSFLGLVPVDLKLKVVVSAQNGQVLQTRQGLLTRLLDFFSI